MGQGSNYRETQTRTDMEIMIRDKLETEKYKVDYIRGSQTLLRMQSS